MSIIDGLPSFALKGFRGAQAALEDSDISPEFAMQAANVKFFPGRVESRSEFKDVFTLSTGTGAYDGVFSAFNGNCLLYTKRVDSTHSQVIFRNLDSTVETIIASAGMNLIAFEMNNRLFWCSTYNDGTAAGSGVIVNNGGTITGEQLFRRPLFVTTEMTLAVTETASGSVGVGVHKFLVVFVTDSGYSQKASPVANGVGLPCVPTIFTSTGGKNVHVAVTFPSPGTNPAGLVSAYLLMTPANLPGFYKVPNAFKALDIAGGVTWDIDLDDASLRATGTSAAASEDQNWLSADQSGSLPFSVRYCGKFGDRAAWVSGAGIYFSEPGEPERISSDQHFRQLPSSDSEILGVQEIGTSCVAWLASKIYSFSDTGGKPATWPAPDTIDGQISSPSQFGFSADTTTRQAIVGSPAGMYLYDGGKISRIPLSLFTRTKWEMIDWTYPGWVKVVLDASNRKVWVSGPKKSALGGGMILYVYDYTNGLTPREIDFSDWTPNFSHNSIRLCKTAYSKSWEPWVTLLTGGVPFKRLASIANGDSITYIESAAAITPTYITCPLPPNVASEVLTIIAAWVRAKGTGTLQVEVLSVDSARTAANPPTITLSSAPARGYLLPIDAQGEWVQLKFTLLTPAPGDYMLLSALKVFYDKLADMR